MATSAVTGRPPEARSLGTGWFVGLLALAAGSIATTVAVMSASGERVAEATAILGPAFAELAATAACMLTATYVAGRARLAWSFFAVALGLWGGTDAVRGAAVLGGLQPPEVSAFDVGWLAYYVPALAGVALLYLRLRPKPGWQDALDGANLTLALLLFAWVFVLRPLTAEAGGMATVVASLYPALNLTLLAAVGWMMMRHRGDMPGWLWLIGAAFGMQVGAEIAYVAAQLQGVAVVDALSTATYMAAGWLWVAAAQVRRHGPRRPSVASPQREPVWSQALPFLLVFGMEALYLSVSEQALVGAAALVGIAIATVRITSTLVANNALLEERDRLLDIDTLTGAYNRRFLEEELARAAARARSTGESLTVLTFDVDGFKQVNDTHGHGTGDLLLQRAVEVCQRRLRMGDLLCRLGGDEFVVLAPGGEHQAGMGLAERLREAVRTAGEEVVPDLGVTASVGFVAGSPAETAPRVLLERADEALYAAKAAGRNRSVDFAARPAAPAPPDGPAGVAAAPAVQGDAGS